MRWRRLGAGLVALVLCALVCVRLVLQHRPPDRQASESPPVSQPQHLLEVIREGNTPRVKALVGHDAKLVQMRDSAGFSPLHVAADSFQLDVVKFLLEQGADVNLVNQQGLTPLHCAAQQGHWRIAKQLVEAGAHVDAVDEDGWTPLHWATYLGYDAVAELLVRSGAAPGLKNRQGMSPLDYALRLGPHDLVAVLCAGDAAALATHRPCRRSIWHELARRGLHDEVASAALAHPALYATEDCFHERLVFTAYRARHWRLGMRLANLGGEVNQPGPLGLRPLHVVVQHGDLPAVKRLVSRLHPDQDACDDEGQTALHWAVRLRHAHVASYLVSAGADPSRRDARGRTPASLARISAMEPLARDLRAKGEAE